MKFFFKLWHINEKMNVLLSKMDIMERQPVSQTQIAYSASNGTTRWAGSMKQDQANTFKYPFMTHATQSNQTLYSKILQN